ncbi:hypothetical protein HPP92_009442 [Vanilla planifolia]|uniref:GTD-binding domain-containing protein n=1 Tax=Vanilla planifolia TaxID=51239 RepID=A0A835V5F6_VANPL|nr:hypothetical protein HPP92_009442 [Vanilla planifolia]
MAANRFATMLHRSTNRMAFLLVYTVLEWMLIVLLLLNALFSYLIAKFASFFGLKPPCIFCSRVDHLFESGEGPRSCKDLLCEAHIGEVSKMEFSSKDPLFSEAVDKRDNCAASRSGQQDPATDMLSWSNRCEMEEKDPRCPSCGVVLESSFFDAVPTASATKGEYWDDLESAPMSKSVKEVIKEEEDGILGQVEVPPTIQILPDHRGDKKVSKDTKEEGSEKEERQTDESVLPSPHHLIEDASVEILASSLEIISYGERLIPLELIDTSTTTKHCPRGVDYDDMVLGSDAEKQAVVASRDDTDTRGSNQSFGMLPILESDSYVPVPTEEPCEVVSVDDHCIIPQLGTDVELVLMDNAEGVEEMQASEGNVKTNEDTNCEISIGSEICDQEHIEHAQIDESASESEPELVADQCPESFIKELDLEPVPDTEPLRRAFGQGKHLTICPVINEVVEEKMPETPTTPNWIEGFPVIPKRFLLERRESGTESLDGSIASDLDNIEPLNMDRLKAVLKAERRALIALYAELEEERSASAIAANQTMAMITRLQEEKAAMQMEALQYQRMMEQQAEYDQEALQLLNELVLKREKEKQDLEKELDLHRKKESYV